MAHLVLFTDANFGGAHKHIFDEATQLSLTEYQDGTAPSVIDGEFPDGVSSIAIFSGNWKFFRDENLESALPVILGPGLYRFVGDFKLPNDGIRSLQAVTDDPNMPGDPLDNHVLLFENGRFHGAHQHVFEPISDLGNYDFSKVTSSIVVELGNWSFYGDTGFGDGYPQDPVFGPGIYPSVTAVGIANDDIASLQPSTLAATAGNAVNDEVILSQYPGFFGPHKHVFAAEPNLNASDDSSFNDKVSSLAILDGDWSFYSDASFLSLYNVTPAPPGAYPDLATLSITPDDMSSLRPAVPATVTAGQQITGEVILFADENFAGAHRHVLNAESDLGAGGAGFNDTVSSIVVVSGNWQLFRNAGFDDAYPPVLGPGLYPSVTAVQITNDDMSSLTATDADATVTGASLDAHVLLFANAAFHGNHRHVVQSTADLNAGSDAGHFDDITSSMVILSGVWQMFADPGFGGQFRPRLGPGLYPSITDAGVANDQVSSLMPVEAAQSELPEEELLAHIVLFADADLRGAHKHVFAPEPNLNAADDDSFNDVVSSAAVLLNNWFTYRDANFSRAFDVTLGPGLFPWVQDVGIANDAMSSLQVAGTRLGFTGQATINVASGSLPDPVTDDLSMSFLFDPATRDLSVETPFEDLPLETVATMKFDSAQTGSFPADGQVTIPDMTVTLSASIGSQDVTFTLATGTATSPTGRYIVTGSPADAAGNVTLVAAGQAGDDDFSIEITGTFTPRPA